MRYAAIRYIVQMYCGEGVRQTSIIVIQYIAVELIVVYACMVPAYIAIAHLNTIAQFKDDRIITIVMPVIEKAAIGYCNL